MFRFLSKIIIAYKIYVRTLFIKSKTGIRHKHKIDNNKNIDNNGFNNNNVLTEKGLISSKVNDCPWLLGLTIKLFNSLAASTFIVG